MERKLPKNIRQIGNVSDNPKIYVEDYVDTFFNQLEEKANDGILGAFLIGEIFRKDDQDYVFVNGAIQMEGVSQKENGISISEKAWKKGCEECKHYFVGYTIVGWMLVGGDVPLELNTNLIKIHEKIFMRKTRVLVLKDKQKKEEEFFVYKYNDLMRISGHYIYYEKNPSMQNYMIAKRKQNCVTPSEDYEDRAAKDFRSIIREKENHAGRKKNKGYRYALNIAIVLLLLIAGRIIIEGNVDNEENIIADNTINDSGETQTSESATLEELMSEAMSEYNDNEENVLIDELEQSEETEENYNESEVVNADVSNTSEENIIAQGDEEASEMVELEDFTVFVSGDTYEVQEGDTLVKISLQVYGSIGRVDDICEVNELENSDYIYVGQDLVLP